MISSCSLEVMFFNAAMMSAFFMVVMGEYPISSALDSQAQIYQYYRISVLKSKNT
jgi:hypothetical protein